jgi:chromosome segregation ATPase
VNELDKITEERDNKRKEYEALRTRRLNEFMEGFSIITMKLKEMYQVSFLVYYTTYTGFMSWTRRRFS